MRRKPTRTALQLESLETRQALAGDVTVFAIGDTLHIRGDSADNGLVIYSSSAGVLNVTGINQGGSTTTVNDSSTHAFTGINNLIVTLGGGNDALVITDAAFAGSLTIQTGEGNDAIGLGEFTDEDDLFDDAVDSLVGALTIDNSLVMVTGGGHNAIVAQNMTAKALTAIMENGDDTIRLLHHGEEGDSDYVPGVNIAGALSVSLGEGHNIAHFDGVTAKYLTLIGGNGIDEIDLDNLTLGREATINARDGANKIDIDTLSARSLLISTGLGNDDIELEDVTVRKSLNIHDNYGDDTIQLEDITARTAGIYSGAGNDTITVRDATLSSKLIASTGIGNDTLTIENLTAKNMLISLDLGDDTLAITNAAIAKKAAIDAAVGNDDLTIERLSAVNLTTTLGLGDDDLSLQYAVISKKAKIYGQQGTNTYTDLGNNTFGRLDRRNFSDQA